MLVTHSPTLPLPTLAKSQTKCSSSSRPPNSNQPSSTLHHHQPPHQPRYLLRSGVPLLRSPRRHPAPLDALPPRVDLLPHPPRETPPRRRRLQTAPRQTNSRTPPHPPPSRPDLHIAGSEHALLLSETTLPSSSSSTAWISSSRRSPGYQTPQNLTPRLPRLLQPSPRRCRRPWILLPQTCHPRRTTSRILGPPGRPPPFTPSNTGPLRRRSPHRPSSNPLRLANTWTSPATAATARATAHLRAGTDPANLLYGRHHLARPADGASRSWNSPRPPAPSRTHPDGASPPGPALRAETGVPHNPPAPPTPGLTAGALRPRTTRDLAQRLARPGTPDPLPRPDVALPHHLLLCSTGRSQGSSSLPAHRSWTRS